MQTPIPRAPRLRQTASALVETGVPVGSAKVNRLCLDPAMPALAPDAARALAPRIRALADTIERDRRLPSDLVLAMAEAGLFHLCVPRRLGGGEVEPATLLGVLEELATVDASVAWCAMIGATTGLLAGYLPEETARELYAGSAVTGGAFAPQGKAVVVDGGYRVSGRWAFASGCQHCAWLLGGSVLFDGDVPRRLAKGQPDARLMFFPAAEVDVIDTWTVSGLRGTGSHDIAVADVLVPAARSVSLFTDRPCQPGPLYAFPVFGLLAVGIAAVALGIARGAVEELERLAAGKVPSLARTRLAERAVVQTQVAEAEALVRSSRAFLLDAIGSAWDAARAGDALTLRQRAVLRLAVTNATAGAARAVDLMYTAGGGTANYATSPLQRQFRDVHAATQHTMVAQPTWELAGRVLLGVETDTSML
jgi:indole-3-acetate monooxygenase